MKKISLILMISVYACTPKEMSESSADVQQIQGVYVYILSQPQRDYEPLGKIDKNMIEQYMDATKGKKLKDVFKSLLKTTKDNTDFNTLLNDMVTLARDKYPDTEGLICRNKLNDCEAIKF